MSENKKSAGGRKEDVKEISNSDSETFSNTPVIENRVTEMNETGVPEAKNEETKAPKEIKNEEQVTEKPADEVQNENPEAENEETKAPEETKNEEQVTEKPADEVQNENPEAEDGETKAPEETKNEEQVTEKPADEVQNENPESKIQESEKNSKADRVLDETDAEKSIKRRWFTPCRGNSFIVGRRPP